MGGASVSCVNTAPLQPDPKCLLMALIDPQSGKHEVGDENFGKAGELVGRAEAEHSPTYGTLAKVRS
jgi:hypothetical protein